MRADEVYGLIGWLIIFGVIILSLQCRDETHGEYIGFRSYPVDQVFRDHNGYRVRWVQGGVDREIKLFDDPYRPERIDGIPANVQGNFSKIHNTDHSVWIIRDTTGRGYVNIMDYNFIKMLDEDCSASYAEIHLPVQSSISAGHETWGHPASPRHSHMHAID